MTSTPKKTIFKELIIVHLATYLEASSEHALQYFLVEFFCFLLDSFNQMINIFCFPIFFIYLSFNYSLHNLNWTSFGGLSTPETNGRFFQSNVLEQYVSNVLWPKQIISIRMIRLLSIHFFKYVS